MTDEKTSRAQFVRPPGGLALTPRHGLLPAQTGAGTPRPQARAAATLEDSALRIEWDGKLHARMLRRSGRHWVPMTPWGPSEYLLCEDGRRGGARQDDAPRSDALRDDARRTDARHVADFVLRHQ